MYRSGGKLEILSVNVGQDILCSPLSAALPISELAPGMQSRAGFYYPLSLTYPTTLSINLGPQFPSSCWAGSLLPHLIDRSIITHREGGD